MQNDIIRWGVIGVGDVCEKKSAPAMNKIPGSRLMAVMRRNFEKAQDYANRHNVPVVCKSAEELIAHPEVDIIYISTPPDSHAKYTIMAADAGKPAYVEKPMARTYKECRWMIDACRHAGVPLFVAYYRRSLPVFQKVKELLANDVIGSVRFATMEMLKPLPKLEENSMTWRWQPAIAGGGLFFDLGSHQIDLLDYFFGPAISVQGMAANTSGISEAEDTVVANIAFSNDVFVSARWCFSVSEGVDKDELTIYGSKGKIRFSIFGEQKVTLESTSGNESFLFTPPEHIQQPHIEQIVAELHGQGICPGTGESGARTAQVMDAIVADYRKQAGIML